MSTFVSFVEVQLDDIVDKVEEEHLLLDLLALLDRTARLVRRAAELHPDGRRRLAEVLGEFAFALEETP